ncbi:MAG: hypothetical protein ACREQ5_16165 [Candidatus Dormibacteria bacterium]
MSVHKKESKKKPHEVHLGKKGSFKINHPGALRKKAHSAGESTHEFAEEHKSGKGKTARQSRAAIGLMAMHHGKKSKKKKD